MAIANLHNVTVIIRTQPRSNEPHGILALELHNRGMGIKVFVPSLYVSTKTGLLKWSLPQP